MTHVDKSTYRCNKCGKQSMKINLRRHIEAHHLETGGFRCTKCEYKAKTRHSVSRHINVVHGVYLYGGPGSGGGRRKKQAQHMDDVLHMVDAADAGEGIPE